MSNPIIPPHIKAAIQRQLVFERELDSAQRTLDHARTVVMSLAEGAGYSHRDIESMFHIVKNEGIQ